MLSTVGIYYGVLFGWLFREWWERAPWEEDWELPDGTYTGEMK